MTDLDSWLAGIEGEKCGRCDGTGRLNVIGNAVDCPACSGQGRIWPILLWEVCGPLSDWLEEQGDYVRAKLVRPRLFNSGVGLSASRPSVVTGNHSWADWLWLPDPKPPKGMKREAAHIAMHEAARRLRLLWRKPCDGCGGTGIADQNVWPCAACSARGYFPQTLIIGDGPVEVPAGNGQCPGESLVVYFRDDNRWHPVCSGKKALSRHNEAEQWAANHLLRVPKEVLT